MSQTYSCPHCQTSLPLASNATGLPAFCPRCGENLATESSVAEAARQWFVTLPDGRTVGPVSAEQMHDAAQRGQIPPNALVRRGDWGEPRLQSEFLNASPATDPTYLQQAVRNPIGTYFFGPKLREYQQQGESVSPERRRRVFLRWVILLAAMPLFAIVLPLASGAIRGDWELAAGGVLLALFAFLWPAFFFLFGMLMYAGAWFEWQWFFRSRTLRHARGMFGDSGARTFYLIFGRALMIGGAMFSVGSSLLIAGSLLRGDAGQRNIAGQGPPAGQRIRVAEHGVEQTRQLFEQNAKPLVDAVRRVEQLDEQIEQNPHDLKLREELAKAQSRTPKLYSDYRLFRDQWRQQVERLRVAVDAEGAESDVLDENREVPLELDFAESIVVAEAMRFPAADVRQASGKLANAGRMLERIQAEPNAMPAAARTRLLQDAAQHREFLLDIERRFGFRSPELDAFPSREPLAAQVARPVDNGTDQVGNPKTIGSEADSRPTPESSTETPPTPSAAPSRTAANRGGLPLLARFDPVAQTLKGRVTVERSTGGPVLVTESLSEHSLVYWNAPVLPPRYEIEADIARLEGEGALFLVVTFPGRAAALVIDGGDELGPRSGLVAVDRQVLSSANYPTALVTGQQFPLGKSVHILCRVEGPQLTLYVNGQQVYQWEDNLGRLSLPPFYRSEHPRRLHLGSFQSRFRIDSLTVRMN